MRTIFKKLTIINVPNNLHRAKCKNLLASDFFDGVIPAHWDDTLSQKNTIKQSTFNNLNHNADYLNHIIEKSQFALFEQRQWDINLRKPLGTEVLLRIPSPNNEQLYLSASYWVDFAESMGKLEELSYQIVKKLINNVHLLDPHHAPYYVNIPPPSISVAFVDTIKKMLDQSRFPYHFIGVELTERQPIIDHMKFRRGMDALQQLKIPVALDDYGRGYATMHFLRDFHVDRVKIDRSLLHEAKNNLSKRLTLVSLLDFATEFDIEVIAEGVETEEHHTFAQQLNCDGVQGFYSGGPKILVDIDG